jgi:Secretion system C-terminal sorting domain
MLKLAIKILFVPVFLISTWTIEASAQTDLWADEVVSITYGDGAGFGQDFFPDNVLGRPDSTSTPTVPSHTEEELLTLGTGGVIVLAFRDGGIVDGVGVDFTIFENPFDIGNGVFSEPGIVAVSEDNVTWYEFPYDVEAGTGLAGMTPTNGSEDPSDPNVSGGDSFDLLTVGLEHIVYVRITDIGTTGGGNSVGFDLDAVVAVNGETGTSSIEHPVNLPDTIKLSAWPNPFNSSLNLSIDSSDATDSHKISIFDITGRLVQQTSLSALNWSWNADSQPSGQYLIRVSNNRGEAVTQRVVLIR